MMSPLRILVFRIGSLGDTIMSIPVLYAIRQHFGTETHICLLTNSGNNKLVKPCAVLSPHSCVDSFLEYPSNGNIALRTLAIFRLTLKIRRSHFNAVVYLAPAQRDAHAVLRDRKFFRLCGIRQLIGFRAFDINQLFPREVDGRPAKIKLEAEFLLDRLKDDIQLFKNERMHNISLEITEKERRYAHKWLIGKGWQEKNILIAIAPGSKHPINSWPLQRFAQVGEKLKQHLLCQFLVVGGPGEYAAGAKLIKEWGGGINAAGAFSPRDSAALLEYCQVLIGLDTGTTHLAAAVGTCCVGLYSSKDNPGRWHPIGDGHEIIRKDKEVSCSGCMLSVCPKPNCYCMNLISVDEVVEAVLKVLDRKSDLRF